LADGQAESRYRVALRPDFRGSEFLSEKKSKKVRGSVWPAVTDYTTLATKSNASLVEIKPVTGFRHQVELNFFPFRITTVLGKKPYIYLHS
jgi:hypothetical protein